MALREIRKKRGLTQMELSQLSGVAQAYISELETEQETNPTVEIVMQLSRALKAKPADIFPQLTPEAHR